jgi:gliding motility-associated-like protein
MKKIFFSLFFYCSICNAQTTLIHNAAAFSGRGYFKIPAIENDLIPLTGSSPNFISVLPHMHKSSTLTPCPDKEDFNYTTDICNPLSVAFQSSVTFYNSIEWTLDDGTFIDSSTNPSHSFSSAGNHIITMIIDKGECSDTVSKTISLNVLPAKIILTHDTTICAGSTKQLIAQQSLGFCWSPVKYLDNPNSYTPLSTTPEDITYFYTAEITGKNLIINGDFSQGNTGFTSEYSFANPNVTEGQYFVGTNANVWNASMSACSGHTTGVDNMLLVNGAPVPDVNVWKQTIAVTPNTNYAFSTWIEALWPPNPAILQFSINGIEAGVLITASLPTCNWTQFYTTWNSGNNTAAVISIVNKNTEVQGNDFALDDISFAPVIIERDSVVIRVERPSISTSNDTAVCYGKIVQLNTAGTAASYSWSPSAGLSNTAIANPLANPASTTQYIVTGTSANGCIAKDTVQLNIIPAPVIVKTNDTTICHDQTLQLNVSGGNNYSWLPSPALSNLNIPNPVASPVGNSTYYVTVTDIRNCTSTDSIKVRIKSLPVFAASSAITECKGSPAQLTATGGDTYSWQPATGLNNSSIAGPLATPEISTTYTVKIVESTCMDSASLPVVVTILSLPVIKARSTNEVDCVKPVTQLNASGATYFSWQPANSLNDATIASPLSSPSVSTVYIVKGTDVNGCYNYDSVVVLVTHTGDLLVNLPNAFTPNGDGKNDCFGISRYAGLLQHVELSVYDRFGVRVFFTTNPLNCWDGRYNGTLQNAGGFAYILKASTFCGNIFKKGIVMLIK